MVPTILGSFFQLQKAMGFDINLGMVTIPPVYGVLVDIYIYNIYIYIYTIHGIYPLVNQHNY